MRGTMMIDFRHEEVHLRKRTVRLCELGSWYDRNQYEYVISAYSTYTLD
jgi:hypothetical protein